MAGIIFCCLIVFVGIMLVASLPQKDKEFYDERQTRVRGTAWKWAYVTLAVYTFLSWWLIAELPKWSGVTTIRVGLVGLALSYGVQNIICIVKDARTPLWGKKRSIMVPSAAVVFIFPLIRLLTDDRRHDGEWRQEVATYAVIAGIFLVVASVGMVKYIIDERRDRREDADE